MNRTITMNLSGIIFHIEEDAYDKLNKYLSTIRGYFKDSEGKDEIMSDIEARIAEMLQEKVSKTKQAVLMMDIESVIAVMGKPEDFAGESENSNKTHTDNSEENENRFSYPNNKRKRVFRDPDDKVFGGVCSGIANYFDFDPIWLRLVFAVSFFVFGSGLLLYIILCVIIPKAKTTAEKLEMRGEKVDINNIGKAVNEEFEDFKKRMKDFGNEVNSKENKDRMRSTTQKVSDFIGDVFHNMINVIGRIFVTIFVFIGIALLIGLLATIFGRGTISAFNSPGNPIHFSLYEFGSAVLPDDTSIEMVVLGLILFIGVPLLLLIYTGIKYLFGIKEKNRIVKYTANGLWLTGLAILIFIGWQIGSDFSDEASSKQNFEIIQPKNQTLYLDLKPMPDEDIDITYKHRRTINLGDWTMVSKDNNRFRLAYPTLDIKASETDSFQLMIIKRANGFDKKEATYRAKNINYKVNQVDSTLQFSSYFDVQNSDKLRAQDVTIILKVPVGKIIYLSKRMEKIIYDIDNVENTLDSDMVNRRWIMTKQGLKCIDCDGLNIGSSIELSAPPSPPEPPADIKK